MIRFRLTLDSVLLVGRIKASQLPFIKFPFWRFSARGWVQAIVAFHAYYVNDYRFDTLPKK